MNNCSIPSMHTERKITIRSHKHSFTPYPSLSPYSRMDGMTGGERNNFFSSCAVVSVIWFLVGNRFWCYLLAYLEYNTVVALC